MGPDEIFIGIQQDFIFKGYPLWFRPHSVTDILLEVTDRRGLKDMGGIDRVWTKTITDILLEFNRASRIEGYGFGFGIFENYFWRYQYVK
jgi:hypothetical protein